MKYLIIDVSFMEDVANDVNAENSLKILMISANRRVSNIDLSATKNVYLSKNQNI